MPGKDLILADTLSRAYVETTDISETERETQYIHMTETVNITHQTQQELKQATAQDPTLKIQDSD